MHKHIRKKIEHALEFTFVAEKSEIKHISKTSIICLRISELKGNVFFLQAIQVNWEENFEYWMIKNQ